MQLSQKQKISSSLFFQFSKFRFSFEQFQKKMSLIADVFSKIPSLKNVIRKMFRKSRLIGPFEK